MQTGRGIALQTLAKHHPPCFSGDGTHGVQACCKDIILNVVPRAFPGALALERISIRCTCAAMLVETQRRTL